MRIYLDVCCLNRPFDESSEPRVMREAEAMIALFALLDQRRLIDFSSGMAQAEIERMTDLERKRKVASFLPPASRIIPLSNGLIDDAQEIVKMGFDLADAVHLAAAIRAQVNAFVTVDDRLSKRAGKRGKFLGFRVVNPIDLVAELSGAIDG